MSMIACSAAWSTSVTKSFGAFALTVRRSTSSDARLMIAPAARAALTAMLSMGCRACDMAAEALRRGGAREERVKRRGEATFGRGDRLRVARRPGRAADNRRFYGAAQDVGSD